MSLTVLSLFAGIGGLELGLERAGMTVVGQVEIDPYCRRVLAKHWPDVPRHDDVRTAADWWLSTERPRVDVICGGFPCQDISPAGRRAGIIDGERSSLWIYLAHAVRVLRPRYLLVENVAGLLVRGLDVVAADLHEIGYDLRWDCVPAAAVGAPHRRDRWFGIAYPNPGGSGRGERPRVVGGLGAAELGKPARPSSPSESSHASSVQRTSLVGRKPNGDHACAPELAHAHGLGWDGRSGEQWAPRWRQPSDSGQWCVEPDVGRVAHGVPSRVDRLRALGNSVVPQVSEHVGRLIVEHASAAA